ncbi:MAG: hypothetical protein H6716_08590 [Polyangiaceae bacterium]|nr:hypothetical protein [Polyangiaceae bacterium]
MNQGVTPTGPNYAAIDAVNFGGSEECSGIPQNPYLGVEEMMILLEGKLGKIDGEVKDMMELQELRVKQRDAVKAFSNAMGANKEMNGQNYPATRKDLQEAIDMLPEGDAARVKLEEKLAEFDQRFELDDWEKGRIEEYGDDVGKLINGGKMIAEGEWKTHKAEIDQQFDNLGDQSEIEMLKLQSAMTKRTTLVQLTTNIVQKLEAAPDMIAKNI